MISPGPYGRDSIEWTEPSWSNCSGKVVVHWDLPAQPKTLKEMGVVRSDRAPNHLTLGFQLVRTCSLAVAASAVAGTTDCGVASSEACEIACWPRLGRREMSLSGTFDPHSSDRIERTRRTAHQ